MIMQKKLERRRRRREESAQQRGPAGDAPDEDKHKEQVHVQVVHYNINVVTNIQFLKVTQRN